MKCSDIQDRLSAHYDGELSSAEQCAVASHLGECRECASQVAGFERCSQAMRQLPRQAVPAGLWQQLSAKLL